MKANLSSALGFLFVKELSLVMKVELERESQRKAKVITRHSLSTTTVDLEVLH